jgi:MscS family membrane protein
MAFDHIINYVWSTHYLKATAIFIIAYVVMQILVFVFEKILLQLTKKTETDIDDIIVGKTKLPLAFLVMIIGARLASEALEFSQKINTIIQNIINTLIILIAAHVVSVIIHVLIDHWAKNRGILKSRVKVDDDLVHMFHRIDKIIIYALAILYILHSWGIEIGPLIASLGIAGIAVAFALQSTLGNLFGGVSIILDKAAKIGDIIELEDGTSGEVVKVSLRSTKIKTWDNELITIPNGKLADSRIKNWNMPDFKLRVSILFRVVYGSDVDKVKKVALDAMKKEKDILKDPSPSVMFDSMADSSLNFIAYFWIKDPKEKGNFKDRINTAIYSALNKAKIEFAYPTRTLYVKK